MNYLNNLVDASITLAITAAREVHSSNRNHVRNHRSSFTSWDLDAGALGLNNGALVCISLAIERQREKN